MMILIDSIFLFVMMFIIQERLRVDEQGNGLSLRPYCSPTFDPAVVCGPPTLNPTQYDYEVKVRSSLCLL